MRSLENSFEGNSRIKSGKKLKIILICVAVFIAAAAVLLFALKNVIFMQRAVKSIEKDDLNSARAAAQHITNDSGQVTENYVELLTEINRKYPDLLAEFNIDTFKNWRDRAEEIKSDENLPEKLIEGADALYKKLYKLCQLYGEYDGMRADVLEMMEVFNEINRLYSPGEDGKNVAFTVKEETEKVEKWEEICFVLSTYSSDVPNGESIYLLSYLVSETYGECEEIRNQLKQISAKGYDENEPVRVNGNGQKTFSDVVNTKGVTLSVLEKEEYEEYMYVAICRALTQTLSEYYVGIKN